MRVQPTNLLICRDTITDQLNSRPMDIRDIILKAPGAFYELKDNPEEKARLDRTYHEAYNTGAPKAKTAIEQAEVHGFVDEGSRWEEVVYLSIGGSRGDEVVAASELRPIKQAVLMEYSEYACDAAKAIAKESPLDNLKVFTGDAWAARKRCNEHLVSLIRDGSAQRVLVSANSVFHELPRRSEQQVYDHQKFLADLLEGVNDVCFICREPTSFANWPEEVWLSFPFLSGDELEAFLGFLGRHFAGALPHLAKYELTKSGQSVLCHRDLACEAIKKIAYRVDRPNLDILLYELEECHAAFDAERFKSALDSVFGDDRDWRGSMSAESMNSDTFRNALVRSGAAYKARDSGSLSVPLAFTSFFGMRSRATEPQSHTDTKAPEFEEFFGFGPKAAIPLSNPYAQRCIAAFDGDGFVPDYDALLRNAENIDFQSACKTDYLVLRVSFLMLDPSPDSHRVGVIHRSGESHMQNADVDSLLLSSELVETYGFIRSVGDSNLGVIENPSFSFTRKLGAYFGAFQLSDRAFSCLRRQADHSGSGDRYYAFLVYLGIRDATKYLPSGFRLFSNVREDRFDGFFDLQAAAALLQDGDLAVDRLALALLNGDEAHTDDDLAGVSATRFSNVLENALRR